MICKAFEIRDDGTHLPALAIKLNPHDEVERKILERAGYDMVAQSYNVMLISLNERPCRHATTNPLDHTHGRTLMHAHFHIEANFDTLPSGAVIDVQYLLCETDQPCESELK